jgi:hypothetical protein
MNTFNIGPPDRFAMDRKCELGLHRKEKVLYRMIDEGRKHVVVRLGLMR